MASIDLPTDEDAIAAMLDDCNEPTRPRVGAVTEKQLLDVTYMVADGDITPEQAKAIITGEPLPEPTLRERMRVRSQMPELDDIFPDRLDFPGTVVRPGAFHERSFCFGRECRVTGIQLPKGLRVMRIALRLGPDFKVLDSMAHADFHLHTYEGADARVYEGGQIQVGEWKTHRLVPELRGSLYLLVRNDTDDDLRFEGTLHLTEDRVPEPEHETL